ncbi:hypothetical protein Tco_1100872, partial [Tanacetum coccineum]
IMDRINIDDLTIEQYLILTQENHTSIMIKKAIGSKCWMIQQEEDKKYSKPRRQIQEDALRNWVAQINQIKMRDHEINKCKVIHTSNMTPEHDMKHHTRKEYGLSEDKDNLEGIIDYLEPTSHDGFVDPDDEAYRQRRSNLLGMPYKEPPPTLKEEADITRYSFGTGEVFTKGEILKVNKLPRTMFSTIDLRAELINARNIESEDLSSTKRRHWCKPILQWKKDTCTTWASCLEWDEFDDWVRVAFGKVCKMNKDRILKDYWRDKLNEEQEYSDKFDKEGESNDETFQQLGAKYQDRLDRNCVGIKSLLEDGDFMMFSASLLHSICLEAMLREFLVLILHIPFYFMSLMYNRETRGEMGVELSLDLAMPLIF